MILHLMLLLIAVLGSSIYTLIEEESKTGFARGHDKFRFTLLGTLAVSLVLWMSLGDMGSWIAVAIAWSYLILSYIR